MESGKTYGGSSISCGNYNTRKELEDACSKDSACVGYSTHNAQNKGAVAENGFYPWCLKSTEETGTNQGDHNYYRKVSGSKPSHQEESGNF